MEFLRDEGTGKVESVTETSSDKPIIDSGAETESRLGDPAVEVETSEAWPDHQGRDNKETSGKRLRWLHVIGENTENFFRIDITEVYLFLISETKILPSAVLLVAAIYAAVAAVFYLQ